MTNPPVQRCDFYVYALFREDGITPFYIGKGRGRRIVIHERDAPRMSSHKDRIIQNMLKAGITSIPKVKLLEDLTDPLAKQIEMDLIQLIGRWPTGPLANLTKGGDGVANLSEESRAKKTARNLASWADPVVRAKRIAGRRAAEQRKTPEEKLAAIEKFKATLTPERKQRSAENRRKTMATAEAQERYRRIHSDPSVQAKKTAGIKASWHNKESRARHIAASIEVGSRPDIIRKRSETSKKMWGDQERVAKMMESRRRHYAENPMTDEQREFHRARLNSPEMLAKRALVAKDPEVKRRRREGQLRAFATPEHKARRSAAAKKVWAARKAHQYAVPSAKPQES